jgi:hypothetical protein
MQPNLATPALVDANIYVRTENHLTLLENDSCSTKPEPNDLDYSVDHHRADVAEPHRRFLVPFEARQFYGADTGYLVIRDYPLDLYVERLDFLCQRKRVPCGIVEISLRGEVKGA